MRFPATRKSRAFTLVELIVVITILAILGTIGFISIQGYSSRARDSQRVSDITSLSKAAEFLISAGTSLPQPDGPSVTISASGTTIGYQGYASSNVLRVLNFGGKGLDGLDSRYYTYGTNAAGTKYQILGLLENSDNPGLAMDFDPLSETAYAASYDTRSMLTK